MIALECELVTTYKQIEHAGAASDSAGLDVLLHRKQIICAMLVALDQGPGIAMLVEPRNLGRQG